jgi:UDP-N-acetylglucosamine:LPS N-acetylglucosamine transferase
VVATLDDWLCVMEMVMKSGCKVLAVSSGGGHWIQLMRLVGAFEGHDVAYATVQAEYAVQVPGARFYAVRDATRWDRWGLVVLAWQLFRIIWRERPGVVITTGAAPGVMALMIARRFGARTIWIDSIANIDSLSLSGQHAGKVADLWLTQWQHLARDDGPRYEGSVL